MHHKQRLLKFASSTPNIPEYIEWLYSSKYEHTKIDEEISKLTKWDKETLYPRERPGTHFTGRQQLVG